MYVSVCMYIYTRNKCIYIYIHIQGKMILILNCSFIKFKKYISLRIYNFSFALRLDKI